MARRCGAWSGSEIAWVNPMPARLRVIQLAPLDGRLPGPRHTQQATFNLRDRPGDDATMPGMTPTYSMAFRSLPCQGGSNAHSTRRT